MIAHFKSMDKEGNINSFETKCEYKNGLFIFNDLATENTIIYVTITDKSVTITRKGNTNMELLLSLDEKTLGNYKNSLGLEFEFIVKTNELVINNNQIYADYSLFVENDLVNQQKMWLLFK